MKYLALLLAALLLFTASAYVATAQTAVTTVQVTIPCTMYNMLVSKCVPAEYYQMEVTICEL